MLSYPTELEGSDHLFHLSCLRSLILPRVTYEPQTWESWVRYSFKGNLAGCSYLFKDSDEVDDGEIYSQGSWVSEFIFS